MPRWRAVGETAVRVYYVGGALRDWLNNPEKSGRERRD